MEPSLQERSYCGLRFSGLPIASRKTATLSFACGEKKMKMRKMIMITREMVTKATRSGVSARRLCKGFLGNHVPEPAKLTD